MLNLNTVKWEPSMHYQIIIIESECNSSWDSEIAQWVDRLAQDQNIPDPSPIQTERSL